MLEQLEVEMQNMKNRISKLELEIKHLKNESAAPTNDIFHETTKILHEMQIAPNIKGFYYMREAIVLAYDDPAVLSYVTKDLYPKIATNHKTKWKCVERAIRHALEVAWNRETIQQMGHIFGTIKPTNTQLIAVIVDHLKNQRRVAQ